MREVWSLCHRNVSKYIECWCEDAALMTDQSQLSGDQDLVSTDSAPWHGPTVRYQATAPPSSDIPPHWHDCRHFSGAISADLWQHRLCVAVSWMELGSADFWSLSKPQAPCLQSLQIMGLHKMCQAGAGGSHLKMGNNRDGEKRRRALTEPRSLKIMTSSLISSPIYDLQSPMLHSALPLITISTVRSSHSHSLCCSCQSCLHLSACPTLVILSFYQADIWQSHHDSVNLFITSPYMSLSPLSFHHTQPTCLGLCWHCLLVQLVQLSWGLFCKLLLPLKVIGDRDKVKCYHLLLWSPISHHAASLIINWNFAPTWQDVELTERQNGERWKLHILDGNIILKYLLNSECCCF